MFPALHIPDKFLTLIELRYLILSATTMKNLSYLLAFYIVFQSPFAVAQSASKAEQEIRTLEVRRFESMINNDQEALQEILDDDLTYTHANAKTDTKASLLNSLESKKTIYKSVQPEDVSIRVYGSTAIVNGKAQVNVIMDGQEHDMQMRYTDVYAKKSGRWKLVAWQSTRLPVAQ